MKKITLFLITMLPLTFLFGQQNKFKWRVGLHGGLYSYYGDLNERILDPQKFIVDKPLENWKYIAHGASIEANYTKAFGIKALYTRGKFAANDRAVNFKKELQTDLEYFDRSLNAQTEIQDISIIGTFYTDNGKIFSERAFLSPYFSAGVGLTFFDVYGDLYLEDGQRYHYWNDHTIRTLAQTDPNALMADIIEQDGIFETNLRELNTERDESYSQRALNFPFAFGLKLRLGKRLNLNIESLLRLTTTDYLDDVHGFYRDSYDNNTQLYASNPNNQAGIFRGNPNNKVKDMYAFTSISLHYNFGFKEDAFVSPIFYTAEEYDTPTDILDENYVPQSTGTPISVAGDENNTTESTMIQGTNSYYSEKIIIILNEFGDTIQKETLIERDANSEESLRPYDLQSNVYRDTIRTIRIENGRPIESIRIIERLEWEEGSYLENYNEDYYSYDTIRREVMIDGRPVEQIEVVKTYDILPEDEVLIGEAEMIDMDKYLFPDEIVYVTDTIYKTDTVMQVVMVDGLPVERETVVETTVLDTLGTVRPVQAELILPSKPSPLLAEIQEDRIEVVAIESEIDRMRSGQATQSELNDLKTRLMEMEERLDNYVDYNNSVAVRANDDATKTENIAIDSNTEKLKAEIELLKKELNNPKRETVDLETYYLREIENRRRIHDLETELIQIQGNERTQKPTVFDPLNPFYVIDNTSATPVKDPVATEIRQYDSEVVQVEKEMEDLFRSTNTSDQDMASLERKLESIDSRLESGDYKNEESRAYSRALRKQIRLAKKRIKAYRLAQGNQELTNVTPTQPVVETINVPSTNTTDYSREINQLNKQLDGFRRADARNLREIDRLSDRIRFLEGQLSGRPSNNNTVTPVPSNNNEEYLKLLNQNLLELQKMVAELKAADNKPVVVTTPAPVITRPAPVTTTTTVVRPTAAEAIRGYDTVNVFYRSGQSQTESNYFSQLDRVAQIMREYPEVSALLQGYADKSGNPAANLALSKKRANGIKNYLISRGVSSNRITTAFYGDEQASSSNDPSSRRVEVRLMTYK